MNVKLVLNIVLSLFIVGLFYYLYVIIQEPIIFEREKKVRYEATVERLKEIRKAQLAFKDLHGKFAKDFGTLISSLNNDQLPEIKIIGNPDDTTQLVVYDTTFISLKNHAFKDGVFIIDSLPYIPYSHGEKFQMDAGEIEKNRIKIQVFEASAPEPVFLKDLKDEYDKYIDDKGILYVGSMSESSLSGNWE